MNMKQLQKHINFIIDQQIKVATYCMDESLFPDSFQTEIKNCFKQIKQKLEEIIGDFESDFNFEDIKNWFDNHSMTWEEEREILEKLTDAEVTDYYESELKKDTNEITITCDNLIQRERIKEFLEAEIFTDMSRYNAAVENL